MKKCLWFSLLYFCVVSLQAQNDTLLASGRGRGSYFMIGASIYNLQNTNNILADNQYAQIGRTHFQATYGSFIRFKRTWFGVDASFISNIKNLRQARTHGVQGNLHIGYDFIQKPTFTLAAGLGGLYNGLSVVSENTSGIITANNMFQNGNAVRLSNESFLTDFFINLHFLPEKEQAQSLLKFRIGYRSSFGEQTWKFRYSTPIDFLRDDFSHFYVQVGFGIVKN